MPAILISDERRDHREDESDDSHHGEDGTQGREKSPRHRRVHSNMTRHSNAHEAVMPAIPDILSGSQRTFVEVSAREPARDRDPIAVDDGDVDSLPTPLGERDHGGDHKQRDADTEADPRQHLSDCGKSIDKRHSLIVEGASFKSCGLAPYSPACLPGQEGRASRYCVVASLRHEERMCHVESAHSQTAASR